MSLKGQRTAAFHDGRESPFKCVHEVVQVLGHDLQRHAVCEHAPPGVDPRSAARAHMTYPLAPLRTLWSRRSPAIAENHRRGVHCGAEFAHRLADEGLELDIVDWDCSIVLRHDSCAVLD